MMKTCESGLFEKCEKPLNISYNKVCLIRRYFQVSKFSMFDMAKQKSQRILSKYMSETFI